MPAVRNAIVVGAGIGGLTAAIGLRRAGVETTVLERRSTPDRLLTGGGSCSGTTPCWPCGS
ncbi:NAD(P)-binding protein [Actinomadura yumaensis]|uniref:NAD(P)-binding protein n=1 Tax=Actinomadura yumaensis TaxID=111807 RepID=UPI003621992F